MDFCLEKRHAAIGCRSKEWDTASDHNFTFNPFVWLGGLNGLIDHHGFFLVITYSVNGVKNDNEN